MRPMHHDYSRLKGDESSNNDEFQNIIHEQERKFLETEERSGVDSEKCSIDVVNYIDGIDNPCYGIAQRDGVCDRVDDNLQKLFQKYDFKDDIVSKLYSLGVCTIVQFEEFCDDNDKIVLLKQLAKPIHFEKFMKTLGLEKPRDGQQLDIISEYIPKENKVDVVEETPYQLMSKVFSCSPYWCFDSGEHRIISAANAIVNFINTENSCNISSRSYKYDCFISYRVRTESTLAFNLYIELTRPERKIFDRSIGKERNFTAFLDREELPNGKKWKKEFLHALKHSFVFISLLSHNGLEVARDVFADHKRDNVLIEIQTALRIRDAIKTNARVEGERCYFFPMYVDMQADRRKPEFYPQEITPKHIDGLKKFKAKSFYCCLLFYIFSIAVMFAIAPLISPSDGPYPTWEQANMTKMDDAWSDDEYYKTDNQIHEELVGGFVAFIWLICYGVSFWCLVATWLIYCCRCNCCDNNITNCVFK